MVGRSGVSKGCSSCHQRKKGCDLRRPSCGQCLQRGVRCPGYAPGLKFIHDTRSVSSGSQTSTPNGDSALSLTQTPPSCLQSAAQVGLMDHFWYLYLPRKQASPVSTHGSLHEFFQAADHLMFQQGIGKHAFWALSSLVVGNEVSDSRLLREGAINYGLALHEMRSALRAPQNTTLEQLTMVGNLLALYELFGDPSGTRFGFFTHSQGLSGLLHLCGPGGFRSSPAWSAFPGVRAAVIFSAIQRREATFLASEEWCADPFETQGKAPWHKAFDVMAQLPGLLERYDRIELASAEEAQDISSRRLQLLDDCWQLEQVLQTWYSESSSIFGFGDPGQTTWYTQTKSRDTSPFVLELDFQDQIHSLAIVLYWATCVILYSTTAQLQYAIGTKGVRRLTQRTQPSHAAALLVQSIAYFRQPCVGLLMRKIFLFPLSTAYAYFASGCKKSPSVRTTDLGRNRNEHSEKVLAYITNSVKSMNILGARVDILCMKSP